MLIDLFHQPFNINYTQNYKTTTLLTSLTPSSQANCYKLPEENSSLVGRRFPSKPLAKKHKLQQTNTKKKNIYFNFNFVKMLSYFQAIAIVVATEVMFEVCV